MNELSHCSGMPKRASNPPNRPGFAVRLEAARITAGYETQKDFAQALGIQDERYRMWERGKAEPSLGHLLKIKKLTQQSLDWLVTGEGKAVIRLQSAENRPHSAAKANRAG